MSSARSPTPQLVRRRRERLAELIDALGEVRGAPVTQREFAASIGREQGTISAVLGGHRGLGGDLMMAVVRTYRLPVDYFDAPLRPDARHWARHATEGAQRPNMPGAIPRTAQAIPAVANAIPDIAEATAAFAPVMSSAAGTRNVVLGNDDAALDEVLAVFAPERAVTMALLALARRGVRADFDGWTRVLIGAQSAHEHGVLVAWFDKTLLALSGDGSHTAEADVDAAIPLFGDRDNPEETRRPLGRRGR